MKHTTRAELLERVPDTYRGAAELMTTAELVSFVAKLADRDDTEMQFAHLTARPTVTR